MSAPFMAIVAAGRRIWCPQSRPVFVCSGHPRRPPCGRKLNPAICGAKNDSLLWPAQQLQCQMENPTAELCGHTHAGFAPVTVKGQKPKPTRWFPKIGPS